jgi:outer membrane protein assembly factor BamB
VAVGAFDGRRAVVAGSRSFSVSAFYADGEEAWTCNVGAPVGVLRVCDVNGDGEAEVLAGCEDGGVYVIDGRGEKAGRISGEGRVTGIWRGRLWAQEGPVTLVGTSDGVLRAL